MEAEVSVNPVIHPSWLAELKEEFTKPYFLELKQFLIEEKKKHTVYPPGKLIFSAFNHTPFDKVEVVIIGQDPYHGPGQANGLCFSVSDGIPSPPSLVNIFKEIHSDLGFPIPTSGNLERWADQGVMLLNAMLTVRANEPASHHGKGWEIFTDTVIHHLSERKEGLVFLLWGKFAQAKEQLINTSRHYVLKAAHPSPFSAYNGFMGCKHFSKANELLKTQGKHEIDWH
ncbi:MAG TPA: uracil-DNA glycosylase [Bacteroidia bacterium]|jgi:uracil-DNA glycosylase|nr:uracil-DNA glycosylase [Bacteroidia bacterium]